MADIKWIKLATNIHDDEKMKLIDAMPKRDTIHYVWIRILLLGGKLNANGKVFLEEGKPLTAKMLAVLFSRPLDDIKIALKVLSNFGMIEIASDKVIRIVNWDKHQNIEGMERVREQNRKRVENHREKKKEEKNLAKSNKEETQEDKVLEEFIDLEKNQDFNENVEFKKTNNLEQRKDYAENYTIEENKAVGKSDILGNLETSEEASANTDIIDKTNTDTDEAASDISAESANNEDISNNIAETDEEYYTRTISKYQLCEVLLIDDLFKGKINETDVNIMFEIINYRYLNFLPIIVSSEFSIDRLLAFDEGVASRIYEMSKDYVVEIEKEFP